jgi:hypothetical protein
MDTFDKLTTLQKVNFTISEQVSYLRRTYRVLDLSMFDYIGSYIVIFILLQIFNINSNPKYYTAMLPLAVIVHIATGQQTTFTKSITSSDINSSKLWLLITILLTIYYHLYYTPTL